MSEIVTALEVRIDSYRRLSCKLKENAHYDLERGDHESYRFNIGQAFALDFAADDLLFVLVKVKEVSDAL